MSLSSWIGEVKNNAIKCISIYNFTYFGKCLNWFGNRLTLFFLVNTYISQDRKIKEQYEP